MTLFLQKFVIDSYLLITFQQRCLILPLQKQIALIYQMSEDAEKTERG